MQLHHKFIETAKKFQKKIAVHDIATGKEILYERMLLAALIFARKFKKINSKMWVLWYLLQQVACCLILAF